MKNRITRSLIWIKAVYPCICDVMYVKVPCGEKISVILDQLLSHVCESFVANTEQGALKVRY